MHMSKLYHNPSDFSSSYSNKPYSITHRQMKKDGNYMSVQYSASHFDFDGKPHMVSVSKDITEMAVELENVSFELLQLTSVASHDLKEPLRKISIFSKLLRERLE